MTDLHDLRALLVANGVQVTEYTGASLKTSNGDTWGMAHGQYYKNGQPVTMQQLKIDYPKRKGV